MAKQPTKSLVQESATQEGFDFLTSSIEKLENTIPDMTELVAAGIGEQKVLDDAQDALDRMYLMLRTVYKDWE